MSTLSGTLGLDDDTSVVVMWANTPVITMADYSLSIVVNSSVKARELAEKLLKIATDIEETQFTLLLNDADTGIPGPGIASERDEYHHARLIHVNREQLANSMSRHSLTSDWFEKADLVIADMERETPDE